MRGRRQNGEKRGSALQQQGKSRHQKRGLGARHLLQLLVLLAAQQTFSVPEVKVVSTAMLKASTAAAGFLLAPQAAQAQTGLTATPGPEPGQVNLSWSSNRNDGTSWSYIAKEGGGSINFRDYDGQETAIPGSTSATRSYTVTGLKPGTLYSFGVAYRRPLQGGGFFRATSSAVTVRTLSIPPALRAVGESDKIRLNWTYSGYFPAGGQWQVKYFPHPQGGSSFNNFSGLSTLRTAVINDPGVTTGVRYATQIRVVDGNGNEITRSNFALATKGGSVPPTLVSDPSRTVRVGSEGTVELCYNLVSVIHNGITYLESRPGKTRVATSSELKNTVHGVEITEAPASIRSAVVGTVGNINFNPCATVGPGVHSVTWQWNGLNGLARQAGRTTTTFTVLAANRPAKPAGFTATAGNGQVLLEWNDPSDSGITRWEMQRKEGTGNYGAFGTITTGTSGGKLTRPVTGLTNGTEYGFRVRAVNANGAGVPSDEQLATPENKTITLTSDQSNNRITEGNTGTKDVVLTVTLGQPAPAGGVSGAVLFATQGTTAQGSGTGTNPCTPPLSPLDTDYCYPAGSTFTIAEGDRTGTVTIKIIGDTRDESDETIKFVTSISTSGWTDNSITLTIEDDDAPTVPAGKNIRLTTDQTNNRITEGNAGRKDVTITATLGQPAPTGGLKVLIGDRTASNPTASLSISCTTLSPASADACYGDDTGLITIAAGDRSGTATLRIIGDTTDEVDETLKLGGTARDPNTLSILPDWSRSPTLTFTIEDDDGKKIRLTSDQTNNRITEGDSGTKSVVVTFALSEPAPAGGIAVGTSTSGTSTRSTKIGNNCGLPRQPADADWCTASAIGSLNIAEGQTQGTATLKIIGDNRGESDETIILAAGTGASGWSVANSPLTLTIEDDDSSVTGKNIAISVASATIAEGNTGKTDVTVTYALGESPSNALFLDLEVVAASTTATDNTNVGATSCTAPSSNADVCYPGAGANQKRFSISRTTSGSFKIGILGDTRDEPNETFAFRLTPISISLSDGWTASNTLTLTITDDDEPTPGVTVTGSPLTVAEGGTGTYTVKLDTSPSATVTVTPTSSDTGAATVSPASHTFNSGNYGTPKTFTVTGQQDQNADDETVTITHAVAGGDYASVTAPSVNVTVTDDEDPVLTPALTTAANSSTNGEIDLTWTHGGGSTPEKYVSGNVLSTPTAIFWQAHHRLKGAASWTLWSNTSVAQGRARRTVSLSLRNIYPAGASVEFRVRTAATDTATGAEINGPWSNIRTVAAYANTQLAALTFVGAPVTVATGATKTYTVALTKAFAGTLSLSSSDTTKATVSPPTLTFTTGNYNTAQTVTVTGVATGGSPSIGHAFRLTGASADAIPDAGTVSVTVEAAAANAPVLATATSTTSGRISLTWTHAGSAIGDLVSGAANFSGWQAQTRLKGGSWSNEPVLPSSSRTNIATRSARVQPGDDYPGGAVVQVRIRARGYVTGTSGTQANGPWSNAREVTYKNDNLAALTLVGDPVTVTAGSTQTYTVALTKAFAGALSITSGATGKATVDPSSLTFTTGNYNTAQTVTITGVEAGQATINHAFRLTGASADAIPDAGTVSVTVGAAPPAKPTNFTATAGNGQVTLNWSDPDDATITRWEYQQKTGGNFGDTWTPIPSSGASTTSHTVTSLTNGTAYTFRIRAVSVAGNGAVSDERSATPVATVPAGVTVSVATLTVDEGGSGAYTMRLNTAPTADVTVTVGGASGEVTVSGSPLTFTTSNYANPQTVTVNAGEDQDTENDSATLTHSASGDTSYGSSLTIAGVRVTVTDNDTPGGGGGNNPSAPTTPSIAAPAQPTGLTAKVGNAQVALSWSSPANATITKWQVQQKQADGSYGAWVDIPDSGATTTSHTVTGLSNGTAYDFRIRAVNAGGNSPASAEVRATPMAPPLKPTGVTATAGHAQVTLSWDNPDNATISKWQYQQKQGDGSYGPWMDIPNSTATTTSHTVTGLTNGVTYSFRIRAVNAGGNGAPSDEVTVTPIDQDVVQADKARSQALAATSRTLLGMATDVLGARSGGDAPVALAAAGDSLGEQAMGVVENLLGIGGSELPTSLTLEEMEDRLWSQSFQLTPPAKGSDGQQEWNPSLLHQRSWALWGAGELRSYRGNDDAEHLSYSGNVKTAWLGIDQQFTDRWMAGAALSFATSQSDYSYRKTDGSKDGGKMESRLTTFYPYGSFQVSEGLRLWGMAGMGWGSQHHQQTGEDTTAEGDLRLQMGVIGFERSLSSIGELSLSLAGDAGLVKSTTDWKAGSGLDDLDVSLHRIRLGIDSSFPLAEHTTAYLNLKGRLDGGDLDMNAAEIVAGLHYGKERFSGFLQGRQTYAFDGSYAESALTAQLRLISNTDGTGLAWTLQPSYGASDGDLALAAGPSLWTDEQLEALTGSNSAQESREMALSSRVGYGIRFQPSDLLLTPFTEVRLSEAGSQHIGLGLALEGNSWNLELSSSREKGANSSPTTKTELNFSKKL